MRCAKCGIIISSIKCGACGFDHSTGNVCFLVPPMQLDIEVCQQIRNQEVGEEVNTVTDFKVHGRTLVEYIGSSPTPCVPDGICIIGKKAFADNKEIQSVTLPDTVTAIEEGAFSFCYNLKTINLPPNLERIGEDAFAFSGLNSICLPDSLTSLGERAFMRTEIEKIRIPSQVAVIPEEAFDSCYELDEVELCLGVEAIMSEAFSNCWNLERIKIPDSLRAIDWTAFRHADNISVVITSECWEREHPDSLRLLIPSPDDAENFVIKEGVLIHYCGRKESPVIPAGVTKIGKDAFSDNKYIRTIAIPEGVLEIAERAFWFCGNLRQVILPSVAKIEASAFYGCNNLRNVNASLSWKVMHPIMLKRILRSKDKRT